MQRQRNLSLGKQLTFVLENTRNEKGIFPTESPTGNSSTISLKENITEKTTRVYNTVIILY